MGKKNKRNKIPKNKDIEELVEKAENGMEDNLQNIEEDITMEQIIAQMDKKRQEFIDRIKLEKRQINKKTQLMSQRLDAQYAEEQKKGKLWKTIYKMQEQDLQEAEER